MIRLLLLVALMSPLGAPLTRVAISNDEQRLSSTKKRSGTELVMSRWEAPVWGVMTFCDIKRTKMAISGAAIAFGYESRARTPDLVVMIVGEDGSIKLFESSARRRVTSHFAYPQPKALLLWESLDVCAVWVEGRAYAGFLDQLWTYQMSDGCKRCVLEPQRIAGELLGIRWDSLVVREVHAIDHAGLVMVLLAKLGDQEGKGLLKKKTPGGILCLFGIDGNVVYHEELEPTNGVKSVVGITAEKNELSFEITCSNAELSRYEFVHQVGDTWVRRKQLSQIRER